MTAPRRAYALALALLTIGSVVIVIAFGMTWATVTVGVLPGAEDATRQLSVSGREIFPGAAMAGWVGLACVAGILATRSWGRILVAVVGLLAGLAAAVAAAWFAVDSGPTIASAVADTVSASARPTWVLALLGGLAVAVACGATIVRGRTWPAMGARYERRTTARRTSDWDAQDAGEDPTDDRVTGPEHDPDTGTSA